MRFEYAEHAGVGVHTLVTGKFKTTTVVLNVQRPLREGVVTRSALIPHVLSRGTARYPSVRALQERLDDLYGAFFNADVFKLGERHVMQFRLEWPNEKFLPGHPPVLDAALELLDEVLTNPLRGEDGLLSAGFIQLEKDALRRRVEGLFNNKGQYAGYRCVATMCAEEPYRLYSGGAIADLETIDAATLTADYADMLATAPMDLFVVGDVDPRAIKEAVARRLTLPARAPRPLPPTLVRAGAGPLKEVTEHFEVNQAQLVLGCRTPIDYASDDFTAMLMCNGILGGFAHSKLFMNVREKASLAYSARSRYEAHKGLLLIHAGIDPGKRDEALALIRAQLDAMREGDVSEQELEQTRAMLQNTYREANDSPGALVNLAYEARVAGLDRDIEAIVEGIPRVTRDDISRVAKTLHLDTIYFLRDSETRAGADGAAQGEVGAHA